GPQVGQGVANLAQDRADLGAEAVERGLEGLLGLAGHAVELEGDVGQGLADPVVHVTGDARALLVGPHAPEAGEPAGVVDGQGGRVYETVEELELPAAVAAGIVVFEGDEAHQRAPGPEGGVEPGA